MQQSNEYTAGQIWLTKSIYHVGPNVFTTDAPRYVAIIKHDAVSNTIVCAPISSETLMACQYDLIVRSHDSSLQAYFMVEAWHEIVIRPAQLDRLAGHLSEYASQDLKKIYYHRMMSENIPLNFYNRVGNDLREKDRRHEFQSREIEAMKYLSNPMFCEVFAAEKSS